MKYLLGAGLFIAAAFLAAQAIAHWRAALAEQDAQEKDAGSGLHPSLELVRVFAVPTVAATLGLAAATAVFVFAAVDGHRYISIFDLFGFLALIGAYGLWLKVKSDFPSSSIGRRAHGRH